MDKDTIIRQWLEGRISAEEAQRQGAFSAEEADVMRRIAETPRTWREPEGQSKKSAWEALENKIDGAEVTRRAKGRFYRTTAYAAAASVALLFLAVWVLIDQNSTVRATAAIAETQQLALPDGSDIRLNAASEIVYEDKNKTRSVTLKGEAYFEVTKNKEGASFQVSNGKFVVEVLGTAFNVRAYPGEPFSVQCREGKVRVSRRGDLGSERTLTAGQRVVERPDGTLSEVERKASEPIAAWQQGRFDYKSEPLDRVLAEFERQYGKPVSNQTGKDFSEQPYTGPMRIVDIEQTLEIICTTFKFDYRIDTDSVYLYSKGEKPAQ